MSTKFDIAIRNRLEAQRGEWQVIAKKAGVSHSWLSQFMRGLIPNPGIRTLEKLDAVLPEVAPSLGEREAKQEVAHG